MSEQWVQSYEAPLRSDDVDKLREDGYVWGGWDWAYLEELQTRCAKAGLNASIGFHEDAGYYLAGPGGASQLLPNAQGARATLLEDHSEASQASGSPRAPSHLSARNRLPRGVLLRGVW